MNGACCNSRSVAQNNTQSNVEILTMYQVSPTWTMCNGFQLFGIVATTVSNTLLEGSGIPGHGLVHFDFYGFVLLTFTIGQFSLQMNTSNRFVAKFDGLTHASVYTNRQNQVTDCDSDVE